MLAALGGLEYSSYSFGGFVQEKEVSWFEHMKAVWTAAEEATRISLSNTRKRLLAEGMRRKVALDGGWATRGYAANHFSFIARDMATSKFVSLICLNKRVNLVRDGQEIGIDEGNYEGTSKGMEAEALHQWLTTNEDDFLDCVDVIVTDGDVSNGSTLARALKDSGKVHAKDGGHFVKNTGGKLHSILGGRYDNVYRRMQVFLSRVVKRVHEEVQHEDMHEEHDARVELFNSYWSHAYNHYFAKRCDDECPCKEATQRNDQQILSELEPDFDDPSQTITEFYIYEDEDDDAEDHINHILGDTDDNQDNDDGNSPANVRQNSLLEANSEQDGSYILSDPALVHPSGTFSSTSDDELRPQVWQKHRCARRCKSPCDHVTKFNNMCSATKEIFEAVSDSIGPILWGANTAMVENSHSVRAKHVDKTKAYGNTYQSRAHLSVLIQNEGYLSAATLIWEQLMEDVSIRATLSPLSRVMHDRLAMMDRKRLRDSSRKKSEEFKKYERDKNRQKSLKRKRESTAAKKGGYQSNADNVPKASKKSRKRAFQTVARNTTGNANNAAPSSSTQPLVSRDSESSEDSESDPSEVILYDSSSESDETSWNDEEVDLTAIEQLRIDPEDETPDGALPLLSAVSVDLYQDDLARALELSIKEQEVLNKNLAAEFQLFIAELQSHGLIGIDLPNSRDGNCYFHVLAANLRKAPNDKLVPPFNANQRITPAALRQHVVSYLIAHPDMPYVRQSEHLTVDGPITSHFKQGEFEKYCESMKRNGVFADDVVVAAACNSLNLVQHLYWGYESEIISPTDTFAVQPLEIRIGLLVEAHHYLQIVKM